MQASSNKLVTALIKESTKTIMTNRGGLKAASESIIAAAEKNAQDLGLDLSSTADQARATAQYTGEIVELANNVINAGYFGPGGLCEGYLRVGAGEAKIARGSEMAVLAGTIYAGDVVEEVNGLDHSVVARGISQNVRWVVTDHVHKGKLERVVTIKGFDATDQGVDREELVVDIVR